MSTDDLTRACLEQLQVYVHTRDETEWYYGNKEQFEKRHQKLLEWVDREIQARDRPRATKPKLNER